MNFWFWFDFTYDGKEMNNLPYRPWTDYYLSQQHSIISSYQKENNQVISYDTNQQKRYLQLVK